MGYFRLFLALSVAVRHMGIPYTFFLRGQVAVISFFIISGFFMALVINGKYHTSGDAGWKWSFYKSRALRVFPVYFVGLALMAGWMASKGHPTVYTANLGFGYLFQSAMMLMNTFTLGLDWMMLVNVVLLDQVFDPNRVVLFWSLSDTLRSGIYIILPFAWALSTILTFYLLAPFVVKSLGRILILGLASLALRMAIVFSPDLFSSWGWEYFFSPAHMVFFCMGALAYHLYLPIRQWPGAGRMGMAAMGALFIFFIGSIILEGGVFVGGGFDYHDRPQYWLYYIAITLCIPFMIVASKSWAGDRLAGELSYPMYIIHPIILLWLYDYVPMEQPLWQMLVIIIVLLSSWALLVLVDRPIQAWRTGADSMAASGIKKRSAGIRWAPLPLAGALLVASLFIVLMDEPLASPPVFIKGNDDFKVAYHKERYFAFPRMWNLLLTREDIRKIEQSASGASREEAMEVARRQPRGEAP